MQGHVWMAWVRWGGGGVGSLHISCPRHKRGGVGGSWRIRQAWYRLYRRQMKEGGGGPAALFQESFKNATQFYLLTAVNVQMNGEKHKKKYSTYSVVSNLKVILLNNCRFLSNVLWRLSYSVFTYMLLLRSISMARVYM